VNLPLLSPDLEVATPGIRVVPLSSGRYRVLSRSGALLGMLEHSEGGVRALRFSVRERGFRDLGEFPTATRAADALRV